MAIVCAHGGYSLEVDIATGEKKSRGQFREDLLFTHRGLSGPAVLQISSFWREGATLTLNLLPVTMWFRP
jgi:predicted flavoprotein YhiN